MASIGTVVFLSHLCRTRFFAHICGKKRERASSSHLDLWLRILGSTSAFATCQAILLVRNFVEVLVELEFLKSIHIWVGNQGSTVCTLGDDTVVAVKKTALEKIEALCGGTRARARILFSFPLFRVFVILWREKEALEGFQGFSFRVWRSWRKLTVLGRVFSSLRR